MRRLDSPQFAFARAYREQITAGLGETFRRVGLEVEAVYELIGRFVRAARAEGIDAGRVAMALDEMVEDAAVSGASFRQYRAVKDQVIRWSIDEFYGTRPPPATGGRSSARPGAIELRSEAR